MMSEYNDEYFMDEKAKEAILDLLSKLGIKSAEARLAMWDGSLDASTLAGIARQAADSFGVPDRIYINQNTLDAMKKVFGK